MRNKLKWYIVDKKYVKYLKQYDDKVEDINYKERIKPYIGILITIDDIDYYVPISSAKEKHYNMNEDMDFIKIVENGRILGVLNLNNMIPINKNNVRILKYDEIDEYRDFNSDEEKHLYISLLNLELRLINNKIDKIKSNAVELYNQKLNRPNSKISKRCCNFKLLEEKCKEYNISNEI